MTDANPESSQPESQRLDKWLWFARMVKTRTLATRLVTSGKVRVNREKINKAAHCVRAGDVVRSVIHTGDDETRVVVSIVEDASTRASRVLDLAQSKQVMWRAKLAAADRSEVNT